MSQTKILAGGFDADVITGTTALAATPATTDEMLISDAGTLKRLDMTHMMFETFKSNPTWCFGRRVFTKNSQEAQRSKFKFCW